MFQHTKSAMEGADSLNLLTRVEQKLDEMVREKEFHKKNSKKLEQEEKHVKADIQAQKHKAKQDEESKMKMDKIKEKEKRFQTAQDKILKGKERMRPTRVMKREKEDKKAVEKESDSFDEKYYEAPN